MGKKAPALTVASLAMTMTSRPCTRPTPVTTPAEGAPPHSRYMPHAAHRPSSKNDVSGSMSLAMRSRAVRRPLSCCRAMAFAPPPSRIFCSWRRNSSSNSFTWLLPGCPDQTKKPEASARVNHSLADASGLCRARALLRPVLALARRRDVQHLAVLRHRPPLDRVAGLVQPGHQVLVGQRVGLVLLADQLL